VSISRTWRRRSTLATAARSSRIQGDHLAGTEGIEVMAVSRVYETDPVGGPVQDDFLNAVVAVRTTLAPRALLRACQAAEAAERRVRVERWGPRTLDVDVLLFDGPDHRIDEPDLVVPHPRLWERAFVVVPLADVAPDVVGAHPTTLAASGVRPVPGARLTW